MGGSADVLSSLTLLGMSWNWGTGNNNGNLYGMVQTHADSDLTSITFNDTFAYDGVNRLAQATDDGGGSASGGWVRTFNYDQYGNMWVVGADGTPVSGLMPTSNDYVNNQISSATYDAAGNEAVMGAYTLTYDGENRQTSSYDSVAQVTTTYAYDAEGRRVEKDMPGPNNTTVKNVYAYDAFGNLAAEYNNASTAGALDCQTCYLTADHLGSTRLVTDASGNVIARHDFVPFGEEIPGGYAGRDEEWGSGRDNVNQKFTGKERDPENGFDFFQARYMSSVEGRFLSPDPASAGTDATYVHMDTDHRFSDHRIALEREVVEWVDSKMR